MQAAVGLAQLDRLDGFIAARRRNFDRAEGRACSTLEEYLILPEATPGSGALLVRLPDHACAKMRPFTRDALVLHLNAQEDRHAAAVRRQSHAPALHEGPQFPRRRRARRTPTSSSTSTFWIGVYPGLAEPHLDYVIDALAEQLRQPAERLSCAQ